MQKIIYFTAFLFGLFGLTLGGGTVQKPKSPNVILIYSDDQGAVDLGCYGTRDILSPNIDKLAATGLKFTRMYAPSPVCSASRAGLMSGKIPARAGVPSNVSSRAGDPGMPASEFTIAEAFQAAGYKTGHFGKWHLGYTPETMPLGQGFEESYGHMGGCIDNYSHHFYWQGPNRHDLWHNGEEVFEPGKYYPELITDKCLDFIEENREKPFFIYLAYNTPHYPLQPTLKWMERYADIEPEKVPFRNKLPDGQNIPDQAAFNVRGLYAAFVSSMDEQVGRVIDTVEKLGLRDDTIIIFQADQGHSYEERTFWGGGSSGPFRGGKFSLFEGGIRVPSVVSWPKRIPQNEHCDELAFAGDWLPSLAALCEITLPKTLSLDGKDISGCILNKEESPHETLFWKHDNQWAIIKGDWKLYANAQDPSGIAPLSENDRKRLLINLKDDPGERTNLAEKHPEIVKELEDIRTKYLNRIESDR